MGTAFKSFSFLSEKVRTGLNNLGYINASPVQERVIPLLNKNKSLIALAPTGTGKTLAYLTPIFNNIEEVNSLLQYIIIVPTVALGSQIFDECQKFKKELDLNISITFLKNQFDLTQYKETANILVVTPSVYPLLNQSYSLKNLKMVVIDEGDMIAFDGFEEQLLNIKDSINCQLVLFSASLNEHQINNLKKLTGITTIIDVRNQSITNKNVKHIALDIKHFSADKAILETLNFFKPYKTIVFVSKKQDLKSLSKKLFESNINHTLLYGDLSKREIMNNLHDFKDDKYSLLLASDFAARGLDICDVDLVISIDLPIKDINYYYHRSGRTGRFDKAGTSVLFYTKDTQNRLDLLKNKLQFELYGLNNQGLKPVKQFVVTQRKKFVNEKLQQEIKKVKRENKSKKVKPCYKKKVQREIERVKKYHKNKIIRTNIRKKSK